MTIIGRTGDDHGERELVSHARALVNATIRVDSGSQFADHDSVLAISLFVASAARR